MQFLRLLTRHHLNVDTRLLNLIYLVLLSFVITACSDAGDPDSYIGEWSSSFNDTDGQGNPVKQAWFLTIASDRSFILECRYEPNGDWREFSKGTLESCTVTVDGRRRSGVRFGTNQGTFYAGNLDAMVCGELRTFHRSGGWSSTTWNIVGGIMLLAFFWYMWREHREYKAKQTYLAYQSYRSSEHVPSVSQSDNDPDIKPWDVMR